MPTGYTHSVQDGTVTELKDFAMICVRAFGLCIDMRDDDLRTPIPESFPLDTSYEDKSIEEAENTIKKLRAMTPQEILDAEKESYENDKAEYEERNRRKQEEKNRYIAMRLKVEAWSPPAELWQLKEFMISQLNESIDFDCRVYDAPQRSENQHRWWQARFESATWSLKNAKERKEERITKNKSKNELLKQLRATLEIPNASSK